MPGEQGRHGKVTPVRLSDEQIGIFRAGAEARHRRVVAKQGYFPWEVRDPLSLGGYMRDAALAMAARELGKALPDTYEYTGARYADVPAAAPAKARKGHPAKARKAHAKRTPAKARKAHAKRTPAKGRKAHAKRTPAKARKARK